MTVNGVPDQWLDLLEDKVPELLRLVGDSWLALTRPFGDNSEDAITVSLCRALRTNRTIRDLPFYVQTQAIELDPLPGQELGRLDIMFLPTSGPGAPDETVYFCLECKRLNVTTKGRLRSGASEYVAHGMLRFVNGQYSKAVQHGSMIGYVLDNDVAGAIASVAGVMRSRHVELCMDAPGELCPSSIVVDSSDVKESSHQRAHESVRFQMHHLFMAAG